MNWRALLAATVVLVCASCRTTGGAASSGSASTIPVGHSTQTLTFDGTPRSYLVYRPVGITGPAPVVVMLHGGFGSAQQAEDTYGWDAQADAARFIVVYPDGISKAWNAGTCCGVPAATNIDDVGFISHIVDTLQADSAVDPKRIYATGMSNGAMLAYRLACSTDLFAAIAPVSGTILVPCDRAKPTSVLHIHGADDHNVPYGGGPGSAVTITGAPRVDGPSVPADIATWRAIDKCDPPSTTTTGDVTTSTASCPGGRVVELITVAGAGHQWPGSKPNLLAQRVLGTDPPS
ncbi:MAG TPA: PHB depolymerase family esterase, partial [Acidimicrobiales bacterium]|nr:PHB depolymerase family esterase [Acidimicrobiales bacterium]